MPSTAGSTASRTPSNAFRVRNRLNFHCKSKVQIQTGNISWSVLWMGGAMGGWGYGWVGLGTGGARNGWGWPFFLSLFANFNFGDCS